MLQNADVFDPSNPACPDGLIDATGRLKATLYDFEELATQNLAAKLRNLFGNDLENRPEVVELDLEILNLRPKIMRDFEQTLAVVHDRTHEVDLLREDMLSVLHEVDHCVTEYQICIAGKAEAPRDDEQKIGLFPLLDKRQKVFDRLKNLVQAKLAEAKTSLLEMYRAMSTPIEEQDRMFNSFNNLEPIKSLEKVRAECDRITVMVEVKADIEKKTHELKRLEVEIGRFEKEASDPARLKGSSVKLLKEERTRSRLGKSMQKLREERDQKVAIYKKATEGEAMEAQSQSRVSDGFKHRISTSTDRGIS